MDSDSSTSTRIAAPVERLGLVLTGGGARGAFQAGALRAIVEISEGMGIPQPFRIIAGASAGSINASYLAATCENLKKSAPYLAEFWKRLHTSQVFRSDLGSISRIAIRWTADLMLGGIGRKSGVKALLDTSPLRDLLEKNIPFDNIRRNLRAGLLSGLEVTATDYGHSATVSFVESSDGYQDWVRIKRYSVPAQIGLDHVMASSAIPLFFPPVEIDGRFYGDGCLRNTAPLSSAIRLGADALLIIGVRRQFTLSDNKPQEVPVKPTVARVLSVILNAILLDAIEIDLERLQRVNGTLDLIPPKKLESARLSLRPVEPLLIRPSEDIGNLAASHFGSLPDSIKYLLHGLGNETEASELVSYLLFEPNYCAHLVEMGYHEAHRQEGAIVKFLQRLSMNQMRRSS